MTEPVWLLKPAVLTTHKMMIAEFGGTEGLRDEGLLESALARPANLHRYENCDDLPRKLTLTPFLHIPKMVSSICTK